MDCPHCGKVVLVKLFKDSNVGQDSMSEPDDTYDLGELLAVINVDSLDEGSAEFVKQTKERFHKYGAGTRMSVKQLSWLKKLAEPDAREDAW